MTIDSFFGEYRFLSNFHPCTITAGEIDFPSVEHAYVASKTTDEEMRRLIAITEGAGAVKRFGRKIKLRDGWDDLKVPVMRALVRHKFNRHMDLAALLVKTGDRELIEGNTWGDHFWGVCRGTGENNLGKILMEVRLGFQMGI